MTYGCFKNYMFDFRSNFECLHPFLIFFWKLSKFYLFPLYINIVFFSFFFFQFNLLYHRFFLMQTYLMTTNFVSRWYYILRHMNFFFFWVNIWIRDHWKIKPFQFNYLIFNLSHESLTNIHTFTFDNFFNLFKIKTKIINTFTPKFSLFFFHVLPTIMFY